MHHVIVKRFAIALALLLIAAVIRVCTDCC